MKKNKFSLRIKDYNLNDPVKKKYYNEKLFTEVAPRYRFITRVLAFGRDPAWKKNLIRSLPLKKNARCLDIACGTGDLTFLLGRKYPDGKITGIDLTGRMLELAKKSGSCANIDFKRADMGDTGFPPENFDIVTGGYALRNSPDLDKALDEIYKIMKKGGVGIFLDFARSPFKLFSFFQLFFLKTWGNLWGFLLHGNPDVYGYIAASLETFPDHKKLKSVLRGKKFRNIGIKLLFCGIVCLVTVEK